MLALLRYLLFILTVNAFIAAAPLLLLASAFWGTEDDQWICIRLFWVSLPFTICLWYFVLRIARTAWKARRGL